MNLSICETFSGMKNLAPPALDLKTLHDKETCATEPILVMISAGADPSQELEDLAKNTIGLEKYHQVPMGQGQQEIAVDLLRRCAEQGEWLCLKNLHLVIAWLPQLEKVQHFYTLFTARMQLRELSCTSVCNK